MPKYISYAQALDGVVSKDDVDALLGLVDNVKNWGDVRARMPGHVIVRLVDEIKALKEQQLAYYSGRGHNDDSDSDNP